MEKQIINFGYANGWVSTPEIVKQCKELKHPVITYIENRCLKRIQCPTCGYEYKIDSGD
jgi:hypothetical protein